MSDDLLVAILVSPVVLVGIAVIAFAGYLLWRTLPAATRSGEMYDKVDESLVLSRESITLQRQRVELQEKTNALLELASKERQEIIALLRELRDIGRAAHAAE